MRYGLVVTFRNRKQYFSFYIHHKTQNLSLHVNALTNTEYAGICEVDGRIELKKQRLTSNLMWAQVMWGVA